MKLRMETVSRGSSQDDIELVLATYADRLDVWPIEVIERVLGDWPTRSSFWPSWHELQEQLPDQSYKPDQIPFHPQRLSAPDQRPIHNLPRSRAEWQDFDETITRLRDPSIPFIARDALLRIGESIEARWRPYAVGQGWA